MECLRELEIENDGKIKIIKLENQSQVEIREDQIELEKIRTSMSGGAVKDIEQKHISYTTI